jgi:ubiquinone/menaquinone biosynthesis C-methylase UbiE
MNQSKISYYKSASKKFGWGIEDRIPEYKIKEILPYISGAKVLDIGCGPGHLVNALFQKDFKAFGVDIVKEFIDFAQKNQSGIFQVASATKLPFKNKEFDTVILKSVIEHLEDDKLALKEALRVGKKVIVIVPQTVPKNLKIRGLIYSHYQDKTHLRTYTKKSLNKLAKNCQAKIIKIVEVEKLPNQSVFFELFSAPVLLKKIVTKLFFIIFKEKPYHLELMAIIKSC